MQGRLKIYGFTLLVSVGLAGACVLAGGAATPQPVPDYALQSREIYRLEIGAAFFIAFYLAVMAIALALDGRGFTELGTKGLKAETVVTQQAQKELDHHVLEKLRKACADIDDMKARLRKLESEPLP